MQHTTAPSSRRHTRLLIILGIIVTALVYLTVGDYGFYKIGRLYWKQRELKKTLAVEQMRKDSLAYIKKRVQNDTAYIEQVAREKLGMARPGETVYKFIGRDSSAVQ